MKKKKKNIKQKKKKKRKNKKKKIVKKIIEKFKKHNDREIETHFISFFEEKEIKYETNPHNEKNFKFLNNFLKNGWETSSSIPVGILDEENYRNDRCVEVFSLIFRDIVDFKIQHNKKEKGVALLKRLLYESKYRLPFFRNVV